MKTVVISFSSKKGKPKLIWGKFFYKRISEFDDIDEQIKREFESQLEVTRLPYSGNIKLGEFQNKHISLEFMDLSNNLIIQKHRIYYRLSEEGKRYEAVHLLPDRLEISISSMDLVNSIQPI